MTSAYDALGGEAGLRPIIDAFVRRVFADPMIGFHFWNVDQAKLAQRELEFTARFLGSDMRYTGRGMRHAHMRHRIMGGHFDRRRQILAEVIDAHQVPKPIKEKWLAHVDALRATITADAPGECTPPEARDSSTPKPKSRLRLVD